MKSRLVHLIIIALGAAAVVLGLLEKVPKYATAAGAGLLLVGELRKAFGGNIDIAKPPVGGLIALLLCAALSCATTKAIGTVAASCEPSTDQENAILDAATSHVVQAEALAAIDALGFALCVLQKGADEAIAALTPKASGLTIAEAANSPALANLRAWRAAHP